MKKTIIYTDKAPRPIGPYSQGICIDGWLYISSQLPLDPSTGQLVEGDFKKKVERVLENLKAIVEAAGGSLDNVVKVNVYIRNIDLFHSFNEVYSKYFTSEPPARSILEVSNLPRRVEIAIDAVAYIGKC